MLSFAKPLIFYKPGSDLKVQSANRRMRWKWQAISGIFDFIR